MKDCADYYVISGGLFRLDGSVDTVTAHKSNLAAPTAEHAAVASIEVCGK
jgi:hypothetical protein